MLSKQQIERLSTRKRCPRCSMNKTQDMALCRRCRYKLPSHMRMLLEGISERDEGVVGNALRAAANYFEAHYQSIRNFTGRLR
jgi:predicted amidophosphoribosyltransferase